MGVSALIVAGALLTPGAAPAEVCTTCIKWNSGALATAVGGGILRCVWTPDYVASISPAENPALVIGVASKDDSGLDDPPRVGSITWSNGVGDSATIDRGGLPGLSPVQTDRDFTQENLLEQWVIPGPTIPEEPAGVEITVDVGFIDGGGNTIDPTDAFVGCNLVSNIDQVNPVFGSALLAISAPGTTTGQVFPPCLAGGMGFAASATDGNIEMTGVSGPDQILLGVESTGNTAADLTAAASRTVITDTNCVSLGPSIEMAFDYDVRNPWLVAGLTLNPGTTTVAEMTAMEAQAYAGGVIVRWRTGFELDNVGFDVYRETAEGRRRLTPSLVAGSMLAFGETLRAGYSYAWWDAAGDSGSSYWIEDVDASGRRTMHGPITAHAANGSAPAVRSAVLLSELTSGVRSGSRPLEFLGSLPADDDALEVQAGLAASSNAVKMSVTGEGMYRVTYSDLVAAGFDPTHVVPRNLGVYADGQQVDIFVRGEADGVFNSGDWLAFYGWGRDETWFDNQVFWLVEGGGPGNRMRRGAARVSPDVAAVGTFPQTLELEENLGYHAAILNGADENFFGAIIAAEPKDHLIQVQSLDAAGGEAILEVAVQGATLGNHELDVELNGLFLGSIPAFDGRVRIVHSFTLAAGELLDGTDNRVTLSRRSGDPSDISLVDHIRLTYPRLTTVEADELILTVDFASTGALRIDGFSRSPWPVLDVTDAARPMLIQGTSFKENGEFGIALDPQQPRYTGERRLLALAAPAQRTPRLVLNSPSTWRDAGPGSDLVIVSHVDFLADAERLATLRRGEGLVVDVVDVEDLYDEFGFGMKQPQALRDFLSRAAEVWTTVPRYLVLVGDASYDPRDYLGFDEDLVPTQFIDSGGFESPTDDWLTDLDDNGVPDTAVGRLPVRTPQEAALVIDKLIAYAGAERAERTALLVTDADAMTFGDMTARTIERLPASVITKTVAVDDLGVDASRAQILGALDAGSWLVSYAGHGQIDYWNADLLNSEDALTLANTGPDQLSFFTMMNCLNGYFVTPFIDSLGEALLRSPGGAMGVWSSSSINPVGSQHKLLTGFYDRLFDGSAATLGEAAADAKGAITGSGRNTWILLGDPTSRLQGE